MKKLLLLAVLIPLACIATYAQTCDPSLDAHVYRPSRLVPKKGCITVTGTVRSQKPENDGDIHIRLQLDPGQGSGLLNAKNNSVQHGFLVFEPLCQKKPTQASAKQVCKNFKQNITIPNDGDRVRITGIHVLDKEPGHGWLEIHPVTKIEMIP